MFKKKKTRVCHYFVKWKKQDTEQYDTFGSNFKEKEEGREDKWMNTDLGICLSWKDPLPPTLS